MSTISFLNIGMHGYINPTLPVVAELVRRGHSVTYHTFPAFAAEIEAAGADVYPYPMGNPSLPEPIPIVLLEELARSALRLLPGVLRDLREICPDLIVHGAACPWGAVAARELSLPSAAFFTTFAFNRHVPSPTAMSTEMLATLMTHPSTGLGYANARFVLSRRFKSGCLPLFDLLNAGAPLNVVFTSSAFQPRAEEFGPSYRFVGASVGSRPKVSEFDSTVLEDPVLYASLGTVFNSSPALLRTFSNALAPLGGTVVVSTGHTPPKRLGSLPQNVLAFQSVPQLEILDRAALFVTHGGMNSVNEAMLAGVPTLVVPQGADQPLVARRVVELGAGLALLTDNATEQTVRAMARRLLEEPSFREAAAAQRTAQEQAGGALRAVDEIERYMVDARGGSHLKDRWRT
jgi:MGT family glycosyltransferase